MTGYMNEYENKTISGNLEKDVAFFKEIFKKDAIIRFKNIKVRNSKSFDCTLIYFDGMVDSDQLNESVIKPLLENDHPNSSESIAEYIETQVLYVRDVKRTNLISKMLEAILYGEALLLIDSSPFALTVDTKGFKTRGINEPEDEKVLQGPREGFEETAMFNLSMLRRRFQTPDLAVELLRLGRRSGTMVFICYLQSLADEKTVKLLKQRIEKIDIDAVLDSNYIAEEIKDSKYSIFKTIGTTERPDTVASRLLEGKIAVIVDGTPVVLTMPYLFSENFQSDEDYYQNFLVSSIGRVLRFVSFFLSVSVPALFIALSSFHNELLPTSLAIAVEKLRGGVPFSPLSECVLMLFVFEILKEAGLRMSKSLGHALSVVGGLVVGQAAVEARIISTPMLIVIALSGISGLMVPRLKGAVFYLRLGFVIISALFGLYGFFALFCVVIIHIISLNSFETDYTLSLRKASFQSLKDTFWRAPWFLMLKRPEFNKNIIRQRGDKE